MITTRMAKMTRPASQLNTSRRTLSIGGTSGRVDGRRIEHRMFTQERFASYWSTETPTNDRVHRDGDHDGGALQGLFRKDRDARQLEDILNLTEEQCPEHGAERCAGSSEEADATDDGRRDDRQVHAATRRGVDVAEL